jgi:CheY-like chemotaxis protein
MKILYVENHKVFAENVCRQFLLRDSVTLVPSLNTARQLIQRGEKFDLLLVDYDLDDGKGDELVRELRLSGDPILIIGVSSHDDGNAALMRAGATAVCSKMELDTIQQVINNAAHSSRHKPETD